MSNPKQEGWRGWDEYAAFYDWENARTLGRRDVPFWRRLARGANGRVLELGCGTGRVALPLVRAGVDLVGIDRSAAMLSRIPNRRSRIPNPKSRIPVVRGDIRQLPFAASAFAMVLAPYGVLQSLLDDRDFAAALREAARVLRRGGTLGIDLVPDVPHWREYRNRVRLRGRSGGSTLTLIESVRQDRRRRLTTFEERYVDRRGRARVERTFTLTFRTPPMRTAIARLEDAGFSVDAVVGDYRGRPWDTRADVWIILAKKV